MHRFFPPKDLVYFWLNTGLHSKAQPFFPPKDLVFFAQKAPFKSAETFPAKRLSFFSLKKPLSKAQKLFPPKDLVFFAQKAPFKSAEIFAVHSPRNEPRKLLLYLFNVFRRWIAIRRGLFAWLYSFFFASQHDRLLLPCNIKKNNIRIMTENKTVENRALYKTLMVTPK